MMRMIERTMKSPVSKEKTITKEEKYIELPPLWNHEEEES